MTHTSINNQNESLSSSAERATKLADKNMERATDRVDESINSMASTVKNQSGRLLGEAKDYAEKGSKKAQETYRDVEESLKEGSDAVVDYIKAQPVKSVFIAAGLGYALSYLYKKR